MIVLNIALIIELIRCVSYGFFSKKARVDNSKIDFPNDNNNQIKSEQKLDATLIESLLNSPQINKQLDVIVEKRLKALLDQQMAKAKIQEHDKYKVDNSSINQLKSPIYDDVNSISINIQSTQQQVAAAAAATLVVAAVRIAAANASCNTLSQATEEIDSYKSS